MTHVNWDAVKGNEMISAFEQLETRQMMSTTLASAVAGPVADSAITMNLSATTNVGLTAAQKARVQAITTTFENSTTELQYGFIKNENDGRGYTAGIVGFCTGTGDLLVVVQRYTDAVPNNALTQYLPRLQQLADSGSDATSGLSGFKSAWAAAASDPAMQAAQQSVCDDMYFNPAMQHAADLGVTSVLGKGQLYDAAVQHGDGDDVDGLPAMIDRTNQMSGGSPKQGVSEATWLANFLTVRNNTLLNTTNTATSTGWAEAVDRVRVYHDFLAAGNLQLSGALTWTVYGDTFTLPAEQVTTTTTTDDNTASISGQVFFDSDEDGVLNNYDRGNEGRVVFLDTNNNGQLDDGEVSTTTDADGNYHFDHLAAGSYNVRLQSVSWMFSTTSIEQTETVAAGATTEGVDFGEWVTYRHF